MCILPPDMYIKTVSKVSGGRYSKNWKCIVADWSSGNCLRLLREARKYGWTLDTDDAFKDAVRPLIAVEHNEHIRRNTERLDMVQQFGLKSRLWNHQRQAFLQLNGLTGAVLDMGMGTGKSLTAISLILAGNHNMGLIVCPKSVVPVWPLEFQRHCAKEFKIYTGPKKKAATIAQYTKDLKREVDVARALKLPFIAVLNYEKMWQSALAEFIQNTRFDFVVYDEAHRLKSAQGRTSKFATKVKKNFDRIIACTGTLLPHSPLDAFGVFRAIDSSIFGTSYIPFRATYAVLGGFEGKQVVAFQNQEMMHDKISSISYRVKSEDVLDLPPFQHIVRHCELEPKTRKAYDQMHDDLCTEYEGHELTAANAMVKVLRLQQITSGIITDANGDDVAVGTEKADLLGDILEDFATNEPIVVFCRFTADIEAVKKVSGNQGRRVFELSGKLNELAEWQKEKEGVLAVQIRAGREGVDFTNACTQIYYSIGHSLGDYDQSLKRTHRPGQTRPVCYIHIVAKETVDVKVYESLDKKRDIVEYVLETLKRR